MTRRSPVGPIFILIMLGFGSSFVGLAPREVQEPASGIPVPSAVIPGASPSGIAATGTTALGLRGVSRPNRKSDGGTSVATTPVPRPRPTAGPSPKVAVAPSHKVTQRPVPAAVTRPPALPIRTGGHLLRATFYCGGGSPCTRGYGPDCLCAAISPDLASWRGKLVHVWLSDCKPTHERPCWVNVRIVDCDCATERGIDLYRVAFSRLADTSAGVLWVHAEVVE